MPLKPKDLRKIWGFAAGGALIKDKLFWYYTYDQHHHIFPGVATSCKPDDFLHAAGDEAGVGARPAI